MTKLGLTLASIALIMLLASLLFSSQDAREEKAISTFETITNSQAIERGRALFLAKGCATCHRHNRLEEQSGQSLVGPNLSHYLPNRDFVRQWLMDPTAIRTNTPMPNLKLKDEEITAIISFLESAAESEAEVIAPEPPPTCPITMTPDPKFKPPASLSSDSPYDDYFWYGTKELWTLLRTDGIWRQLPQDNEGEEPGYVQKLAWWRDGYDWREEPKPELSVTGRRLDAPAPTFLVSDATNGYHAELKSFMLAGVAIPSLGCWEITGHYDGNELSFVVWITP